MTPDDPALRAKLNKAFITSGFQERIYELLQSRLDESMWSKNLAKRITEYINKTGSLDFEKLVQLVQAEGYKSIPPSVENDIKEEIKNFLRQILQNE